ncbi:MAG: LicD family protein [Chloroflexi bacterium]|nr:LicD family protein [Chloroflexota bacterium]
MYESDSGKTKPSVFEPMDMRTAEALLKEAKTVLHEFGIVFFLRHGTCLGAVRDGALIEWDDDLDIGSIIGMHGLTEDAIEPVVRAFRDRGFKAVVTEAELHVSVEFSKHGTGLDWTCYRIIDDSIYQWPVVKIPARLHSNLKSIDFLGEKFNVPNPPEEYLRLKYGPEWMIPKRSGYEQDIMDLMPDEPSSASVRFLRFFRRFLSRRDPGSLQVLDFEGRPVKGAEVIVCSTTVLSGLVRSATDQNGMTGLDLPNAGYYVLTIRHGDHEEVLFMEKLEPSTGYVYRPDPETPSGRVNVLATSRKASDADS